MAIAYKQKCIRCKKNYVKVTRRQGFVVCYECQEKELNGEVEDPEMKKMFDIPHEFYVENNFLRNIKVNYLKFGNLTEKQVEAFNKVVGDMKKAKSEKK